MQDCEAGYHLQKLTVKVDPRPKSKAIKLVEENFHNIGFDDDYLNNNKI